MRKGLADMERRKFFQSLGLAAGSLAFFRETFGSPQQAMASLRRSMETEDPGGERFWYVVRNQFLLPDDYAYMNTGGLGASPYVVLENVQHGMHELEIKPRPGHSIERWNHLKKKCAALFGKGVSYKEIALTNSTTEGNNIVINGLPLKRGDEIITSTHEHAGLNIPLLNKVKRDDVVLKTFEPDMEDGLNNVNRIEELITESTRLIFISHITCTTGQLFPVTEIASLAKEKGIWFALDGAQVVGHMPIDVKEYGCDFYATSGHKWMLGPKRTGIFYVKEEELQNLVPTTVGAYSDDGYDLEERTLTYDPTAERYEYATQNEPLVHGLDPAIDFLNTLGMDRIWDHNRQLAEHLYHGLMEIDGVEVLSPREEEYRTGMLTFRMTDYDYGDVAYKHMKEENIRARGVAEADLNGIRLSMHLYNSMEEVNRALNVVRRLAESQ